MNIEKIKKACRLLGFKEYYCKSSYSDSDARQNLEGRTHYVDNGTLKYYKAKILKGEHSKNGLYYLLQESLPDANGKRGRRNVLFNIFGDVVSYTDLDRLHKTANDADKGFNEHVDYMNSSDSVAALLEALNKRVTRESATLDEVKKILEG